MSEYRNKIVQEVRATGIYLVQHADEIVDKADLKRCIDIHIQYEQGEIPEITITQAHFMQEVIDYGKST